MEERLRLWRKWLDSLEDEPFPPFGARLDYQTIWNTTDPQLSECFQNTVLVYVPCAFLWIFLPIIIMEYLKSELLLGKWTLPALIKIAIASALCLLAAWRFCYYLYFAIKGYEIPVSTILSEPIKLLTFGLSGYLVNVDRRKGQVSAGYQFGFWLLLTLCALIEFRTYLSDGLEGFIRDKFLFGSVMAYYPLVAFEFLMFCFPDESSSTKAKRKSRWPEYYSTFLSRLLFSWFSGLVYKGWRRPLVQNDLWELDIPDKTSTTVSKFELHWKAEVERGKDGKYQPSIVKALGKTYWKLMVLTGFLQLFATVLLQTVALPFAIRYMIWFVSARKVEPWKGYFVAISLFLISVGFSVFLAQFYHFGSMISLRMRSALIGCIYRKALRVSTESKRGRSAAEIGNLIAVDAQRFTLSPIHVHSLWGCLLQIIISVYLLYQIIGSAVFAGLGAMLLTIPLVGVVMRKNRALETSQLKEKDERMKIMNEILNGIKILKLYAWEVAWENRVETVRNRELILLRKSANLKAINMIIWLFTPSLIAVVSFATYVLSDEENILDPAKTFVSLALFGILRLPLALLPAAITGIIQSMVSLKRISSFLLSDELDLNSVKHVLSEDTTTPFAISLRSASFAWRQEEGVQDRQAALSNIDLDILPGSLVAVVGPVGAGKSSLCSAILGMMAKTSGDVYVKGTIAYCSQSAWIQNRSIRENILFGLPVDERAYLEVIAATALQPDLDILPAGDATEIGEKGINLSGGQKQRINIARALYSRADVFILDDPLSACDAHVSRHIFDRVIGPNGLMQGKTRIFVTHGVNFLPDADRVIFVRDGEVSAYAPFPKLLQMSEFTEFHEKLATEDGSPHKLAEPDLIASHEFEEEPVTGSTDKSDDIEMGERSSGARKRNRGLGEKGAGPVGLEGDEQSKLILDEQTETGKVQWKIYATLLKYATLFATFITVAAHAIYTGFVLAANIWLSYWSEDNMRLPDGTVNTGLRDYRLGIFALFNFFQAVFIYISALVLALSCVKASQRIHSEMLRRLLRAPLSFFESTPIGRITNRFSRDLDVLDTQLPTHFKMWLNGLFILLSVLVLVCISTPLFAAVVPVLAILYYFIQRAFVPSSRQIKRLEAVSRSPILSHFQESLHGQAVIRAMNQQDRFIQISDHLNDVHNMSSYANAVGQRWILVRVETLGSVCTFFAALFAVIGKGQWDTHPGLLGLAITYATTMTSSFNWLVRTSSDIEANAVSVERMHEYTAIAQEAPWEIPGRKPPSDWPDHGAVDFRNYGLRYRENTALVLREITCVIAGGERIGVCGRTGAGKTSLISALFRLIEPATGRITVDQLDITELGLHDVRSRLTIIPQDPVLFSGTLRSNLDPFNKHVDDELWQVLELSHLKGFVQTQAAKMDMEIAESGENLSVGQRQLVCLARALLRKSRILILDEATASIDLERDDLIQQAIRKEFAGCTVITVAHRLSTILDYDRIMVLDNGEIQEFDTPRNLLAQPNSLFHGLARTAGIV